MDGALGHSAVDIILHVEVGAGKYVHSKAGDNETGELESEGAPGEGGVHLTENRELGLSIYLDCSVSGLVHGQVEQGSHLLCDDACRGARVEQHIDGAGACHAREDRAFMDVNSVNSHDNILGDLGKASFEWRKVVFLSFIRVNLFTFLQYFHVSIRVRVIGRVVKDRSAAS